MATLEEAYVWQVTVESKDDGHTVLHGYYSDMDKAAKIARKIGGKYMSAVLYKNSTGQHYEVQTKAVDLDREMIREQALSKLTWDERRALGVQ